MIHVSSLLNKHARLLLGNLVLQQDLQRLSVCYHIVLDNFHSQTDIISVKLKVTNAPDIKCATNFYGDSNSNIISFE